jgi:hypothetical protein
MRTLVSTLNLHGPSTYVKIAEYACKLFEKIFQPNVIYWTSTTSRYVKNECNDDALNLFMAVLWKLMELSQYNFSCENEN